MSEHQLHHGSTHKQANDKFTQKYVDQGGIHNVSFKNRTPEFDSQSGKPPIQLGTVLK